MPPFRASLSRRAAPAICARRRAGPRGASTRLRRWLARAGGLCGRPVRTADQPALCLKQAEGGCHAGACSPLGLNCLRRNERPHTVTDVTPAPACGLPRWAGYGIPRAIAAAECHFAAFRFSCRSSVVEHSLGKGEVLSSILSGSTMKSLRNLGLDRAPPAGPGEPSSWHQAALAPASSDRCWPPAGAAKLVASMRCIVCGALMPGDSTTRLRPSSLAR